MTKEQIEQLKAKTAANDEEWVDWQKINPILFAYMRPKFRKLASDVIGDNPQLVDDPDLYISTIADLGGKKAFLFLFENNWTAAFPDKKLARWCETQAIYWCERAIKLTKQGGHSRFTPQAAAKGQKNSLKKRQSKSVQRILDIQRLLAEGVTTQKEIAKALNVDRKTISRDFKENSEILHKCSKTTFKSGSKNGKKGTFGKSTISTTSSNLQSINLSSLYKNKIQDDKETVLEDGITVPLPNVPFGAENEIETPAIEEKEVEKAPEEENRVAGHYDLMDSYEGYDRHFKKPSRQKGTFGDKKTTLTITADDESEKKPLIVAPPMMDLILADGTPVEWKEWPSERLRREKKKKAEKQLKENTSILFTAGFMEEKPKKQKGPTLEERIALGKKEERDWRLRQFVAMGFTKEQFEEIEANEAKQAA